MKIYIIYLQEIYTEMIKKNPTLKKLDNNYLLLVEQMDEKQVLMVRDIMNPDVHVLPADTKVQEAAKLMRKKEIGSIVIVDPVDHTKPIGIITERDINNRVVAENKLPSDILCNEIMSSPVKSILPTIMLTDVMHQMAIQHIKRLIVIEKQQIIGIISQSDILEIAPFMIEILQERAKLVKYKYKIEYLAGYCGKCGNWSDTLEEINEIYICENCKEAVKNPTF